MSREIKFRAWDKAEKMWLFGYKELGGFSLVGEIVMLGEFSHIPLDKLNDLEIMQYTGHKDKNGKEIYEGDWLRFDGNPYTYEIAWSMGGFHAVIPTSTSSSASHWRGVGHTDSEIVGNIYETPSLLEGK